MKNKLYFILIIFCLLIVGCSNSPKKTNYIEFLDNEIVVNMGNSVSVKYKEHGEITNKKFLVYNNKIARYNGGAIYGVSIGETTLEITYNETEIVKINVKVIDKQENVLNLQDRKINEKNYSNFKNQVEQFNEKFYNSKSFIYETEINQTGYIFDNQKYKLEVSASPLYIHEYNNGHDKYYIEDNDKVYSCYISENKIIKNFYCDLDNYINEDIEYETVEGNLEINFDIDKGNIYENGNTYTFVFHFADSVLSELEETLMSLCDILNISYEEITKFVITRTFTFDENSIRSYCKFYYKMYDFHFSTEIFESIELTDFEKVDINDEKYKIYLPTSMEGVDDVTPFNQELYMGREGYLKIDAKKGVLKIIDEFDCENLSINVYDVNKKLICKSLGNYNDSFLNDLNDCIIIPKDGRYYLEFESVDFYYDRKFKIQNIEYNDVGDIENPINIDSEKEFSGTIEGKYDFVFYNVNIDDIASLCITNTGDVPIYFVNVNSGDKDINMLVKINPNENILYPFRGEEKNTFAICNMYSSKDEVDKYDYSFETSVVDVHHWEICSLKEINQEIVCSEIYTKENKFMIYLETGTYKVTYSNENMNVKIYLGSMDSYYVQITNGKNNTEKIVTVKDSRYYYIQITNNKINDIIFIQEYKSE